MEQGLPENGVCNLSHHVLSRYFNEITKDINYEDLERAISLGIRAQDIFIDYSYYFSDDNKKIQKNERRIGQGTIGLGTLLILMGLKYGSDESIDFINKLFAKISFWQTKASIELAKEKGPFPLYNYEKFTKSKHFERLMYEWMKYLPDDPKFSISSLMDDLHKYGIRNVCLSTQAPTGSTGTMLNSYFEHNFKMSITNGIEPFYSFKYFRASRLGISEETAGLVDRYMKENNIESPSELPDYFTTALNMTPLEHIKVQSAIQTWTDSSISKTVNCHKNIELSEIESLFKYAYDFNLKGITIYRDGSRTTQVLSEDKESAKLEIHIEKEFNSETLSKCPACGKMTFKKDQCICLSCNASVCSL